MSTEERIIWPAFWTALAIAAVVVLVLKFT